LISRLNILLPHEGSGINSGAGGLTFNTELNLWRVLAIPTSFPKAGNLKSIKSFFEAYEYYIAKMSKHERRS
jgi:hypothetical protein